MRATIKNYLDAAKQRREENGEAGFSLIELIVVVAILGILVAIAIPVFGLIQTNAKDNALKTVAANAATSAAAELANSGTVTVAEIEAALSDDDVNVSFDEDTYTDFVDICATATPVEDGSLDGASEDSFSSGPGC